VIIPSYSVFYCIYKYWWGKFWQIANHLPNPPKFSPSKIFPYTVLPPIIVKKDETSHPLLHCQPTKNVQTFESIKYNLQSSSDDSKAQKNPTLIVIITLEQLIISHETSGNCMDINQHRVA